jgi:pyridoxamine 5'-phosphate oxidase
MTVAPSPFGPFAAWLNHALDHLPLANAMTLATATPGGVPAARTVLLKAYSDDGFVFFTSPDALKVRHMTENPHVALLFFWPEFNRQIRIDGTVSRIPATSLARGFFVRGVRHGAITWVSPHGRVADARDALDVKLNDLRRLFGGQPHADASPSSFCSFLVSPSTVRFWQGGAGRQHASLDYERAGTVWTHRKTGALGLPPDLGLESESPNGDRTC